MAEPEEKRVDAIQGEIIHVYDGIEEADNALPLWWLWTFYGAIAFAVVYWFNYHEYEISPLPGEVYTMALQERAAGGEVSEELLATIAADPAATAEGQTLFATHCVACHEANAAGNIGPNLTDGYWLHGGGIVAIHDTIRDGVLENGMPAWGPTLGATSIQQLTAFLVSIRDTNVEGKEPQGDLYDPEEANAEPEADETAGTEATPDEGETAQAETPDADRSGA